MKIKNLNPNLIACLLLGLLTSNILVAQQCSYNYLLDSMPILVDGPVRSFIKHENKLIMGGSFDCITTPNKGVAAVDVNGQTLNQFSSPNHGVFMNLYEQDGSGGAYAWSDYYSDTLYHILPNGSYSSWKPVLGNDGGWGASVRSMLAKGGKLYVAGQFSSVNGAARNNFAVFNTATGALLPIEVADFPRDVRQMLLVGSKLYVCGYFSNFGSNVRNGLASIDTLTWNLTNWDPGLNGSFDYDATQIAAGNQTLVVIGNFDSASGAYRQGFAAYDANTGVLKPLNPSINGKINAIAMNGDILYLSGEFNSINSVERIKLGAINTNSGLVTNWDPRLLENDGGIQQISVANNQLYAVGAFNQLRGENRIRLAAFDLNTASLLPWDPRAIDLPKNITFSGNNIFLGGLVRGTGGVLRKDLAAIDTLTGALLPWNPNLNQPTSSRLYDLLLSNDAKFKISGIYSMHSSGDTIFIGGIFDSIGGYNRNGLAAIDGITGNVHNWSCDVELYDPFEPWNYGTINCIVSYQNMLLVAGRFTSAGGQSRSNFAAIEKSTGNVLPFAISIDNSGLLDNSSMLVQHNILYLGGAFSNINGTVRNNLASVNLTSGNLTNWNPNPRGAVKSLASYNNTLIVGGIFDSILSENTRRPGIAFFDLATGALLNKQISTDKLDDIGDVGTIYVNKNTILLGGFFNLKPFGFFPIVRSGWLQLDTTLNVLNWISPYDYFENQTQFDVQQERYLGVRYALITVNNQLYSSSYKSYGGPLFFDYGLYKQSIFQPKIITNITSQSVCTGGNAIFSFEVDGPVIEYTWYKNNTIFPTQSFLGLGIDNCTQNDQGWYKCVATTNCGVFYSDSAYLTVSGVKPVAQFTVNDSIQCLNQNQFSFTNQSTVSAGTLNYVWDFGNQTGSTKRDTTISYSNAGEYWVQLTANLNNTACTASITKVVKVIQPPLALITTEDPTTICGSGVVALSANTDSLLNYTWQKNGVTIMNQNDTTYTAIVSGAYRVLVEESNGCKDTSNTIIVSINPKPTVSLVLPFDTIRITDAPVTLSGGLPLGGLYSGNGIAGGVFSPAVAGIGAHFIYYNYLDSNGCSDSALQIVVVEQTTGLTAVNSENNFKLYPNPALNVIELSIGAELLNCNLEITNALGIKVWSQQLEHLQTQIEISQLVPGTYFVTVYGNNGQLQKRLIKLRY